MMSSLSQANAELTNQLKVVLANFAIPNSTTLLQASKDLHSLSQNSSFLTSLFYIFSNDEDAQIRQTAAIVFRRKAIRLWKSLSQEAQLEIRQALLQSLSCEKENLVKHSVMEIIGGIAKLELAADKSWPELMNVIKQGLQASVLKEKECAAELLKIICYSCAEYFVGDYDSLLMLINEALQVNVSSNWSYFCVEAFNYLVPYLGDDQARLVQPLVPKSVQVIKLLLENNCETQALDLIELFETLIETEVSFVAAYVKDLVMFLLQIAADTNMDDDIRARVLSVLQSIIRFKKKAILKNKLLGPIVEVICPILVAPFDENDEAGFIGESTDGQSPLACALHVVNDMALHFPPDQLFKHLMPFIEGCVASNEERCKRALYLTLACLSEGTSEYIKKKYMKDFLEVVCQGVTHTHSRVRSAALFAMGQFCEHLQPDINQFASEIFPLLFDALKKMQGISKDMGLTKAYYALNNFIENLDEEIIPFLNQLMDHLLSTLRSECDVRTKELVIGSIGSAANAANKNILPFLPDILLQIQSCLSSLNTNNEDKDLTILHSQALDALVVLVEKVGNMNQQLAEDSMKLGMQLIEMDNPDPDLKCSAYSLFGAVSTVVGEKMQPFLAPIVRSLLDTLQSSEGIIANYNNEESNGLDFSFLDDSVTDLESDDDDEAETIQGFSVENAYMDEKVDALDAVSSFAKHCGQSFKPHLNLFMTETIRMQDFPHMEIRRAALVAYGELLILVHKLKHNLADDIKNTVFSGLSLIIETDKERPVVMTAITTAKEVVEFCGLQVFANQEKDVEVLMTSILRVLQQKSACQDDEPEDEEDQQAEYDEMLIETCGEIFPVLADKLKASFLPYFLACLPVFCTKLKASGTTSEKSFAAGTIAQTVEKLGPCCPEEVLKNVVPRFIQLSRDPEVEVRNNVLYGLGVLLQNGGEASFIHFPPVLGCLSQALIREPSRRVIDNILSAVARMMMTNKNILPLDQIIPVFLDHLPIEVDHDEDATVYGCLATFLKEADVKCDIKWVAKGANIFAQALVNNETSEDVKASLENEIRSLKNSYLSSPEDFLNSKSISPESRELIQRLWTT